MRFRYLTLCALALVVLRRISERVSQIERRVGVEGLENPEVVQAYVWVSGLPQFRLMTQLIACKAVDGMEEGRVLELGSGPGRLAIDMGKKAPRLAVLGLDLSEEMLAIASSKARDAAVADRVTFIKGDVDQIPYPGNSFDLVVSTLSLHHWSDPVAVFNEIARVLRPEGRVLIFDLRRDVGLLPWLPLWLATNLVVPPVLRRVGEPMKSREAAYTPEEVETMLARTDLSQARVTTGPFWLAIERG